MSIHVFLTDERNKMHQVKNITDFTLVKSLDSPASAVKISYLSGEDMDKITSIIVKKNSATLFYGTVDRYVTELRYHTKKHTLEARDEGGILLDQEAIPAKYKNVDFKEIFLKYVKPNSSIGNGIKERGYSGEFVVSKGQSVWKVIREYCMEVYNMEPYVYRGKIYTKLPKSKLPIKEHILCLTQENRPCEIIGKVFIRDKLGGYKGCVINPFDTECKRSKYLIPTSEWEFARENAGSMIKNSMRKSEYVKIELDGAVNINAGDSLEFTARGREYQNLTAFEVCIKGNKDFRTRITAVRTCYL